MKMRRRKGRVGFTPSQGRLASTQAYAPLPGVSRAGVPASPGRGPRSLPWAALSWEGPTGCANGLMVVRFSCGAACSRPHLPVPCERTPRWSLSGARGYCCPYWLARGCRFIETTPAVGRDGHLGLWDEFGADLRDLTVPARVQYAAPQRALVLVRAHVV